MSPRRASRTAPGLLAAILLALAIAGPAVATLDSVGSSVYASDDGAFTFRVEARGNATGAGSIDLPIATGATVTSVTRVRDDGTFAVNWFRLNASAVRVLDEGHAGAPFVFRAEGEVAAVGREVSFVLAEATRVWRIEAFAPVEGSVAFVGAPPPETRSGAAGRIVHESTLTDVPRGHRVALVFPAEATASVGTEDGREAPNPFLALVMFSAIALVVSVLAAQVGRRKLAREPDARVTWMHHLRELQARLVRVFLALGVFIVLFFSFGLATVDVLGFALPVPVATLTDSIAAHVFRAMAASAVPDGVTLVVTSPTDGILTQLDVTLLLAVLATVPLAAWEASGFLGPAMYPNERRIALYIAPVIVVLFAAGVAFAYLIMVPFTLTTLYAYAGDLGAAQFLVVDRLVSFTVLMLIVFGVAFETPAIMAGVARVGLVKPRTFLKKWRYAVIAIFVIAAIVSDPTVVSQLIVAVPLCMLYALGVAAAFVVAPRGDARA